MKRLLFEAASGYALFESVEQEEIAMDEVQNSFYDFARFGKVVKLVAFLPFQTAQEALENALSVSEGQVHERLKIFLEQQFPNAKASKKARVKLGVADAKIGGTITETLNIPCETSEVVSEAFRAIRMHFHKFVKELSEEDVGKTQLGLGHSYSRSKVKFNVNRVDNMIIQAISLLDQLDKGVNTFSMRLREWFSYHYPELVKLVPDSVTYARVVKIMQTRGNLLSGENVEKVKGDLIAMFSTLPDCDAEHLYQMVHDAANSSMGMDVSDLDLINIQAFAQKVIDLAEYRIQLQKYNVGKMQQIAPNLASIVGEHIGARLIAQAGSLTKLAKAAASTVQILGAEKALFRALKTKSRTPKYGLIYHSGFITRSTDKNKGKMSRYLANKCSLASRIDCFSDTLPNGIIGLAFKNQIEGRLGFYEHGKQNPQSNANTMKEALKQVKAEQKLVKTVEAEKLPKKKKKSKTLN